MIYAIYSSDPGPISRLINCPAELLLLNLGNGETALAVIDGGIDDSTHYVNAAALVPYGARPSEWHAWSWEMLDWLLNPADVTSSLIARVDAERARRADLPITFAGTLFDADPIARENIAGWQTQLAAGASLPEGFVWRDASNVDHAFTAADINALGAATTLRGTRLYQAAWAHKAQIAALENMGSVAELVAYDTTAAWPEV